MNEVDIVRENLEIIKKNGDLFDVICLKEGVKPREHSFFKFNVLLLSRILFGGVLLWEKIKSITASVEKIRNAQEQIRQVLGINVDIISLKKSVSFPLFNKSENENKLSIFYEDDNIDLDSYINNLQKILGFAYFYGINEILLRESDITDSFVDVNLDSFEIINLRRVLEGYLENSLDEDLLLLNPDKLRELIKILKVSKESKKFILNIGSGISDLVIKSALENFYLNGDLEKLKSIVLNRLALNINSDNTYRDKQNGKVFETVSIHDEYVKVLINNQIGEVISNVVMSLYDYLEVSNFQNLLLELNKSRDDKEILLIATLYLYLNQTKEIHKYNRENTISFYDRIYGRYNAKKNKKVKKVRGIYSKPYKLYLNIIRMYSAFFMSIMLIIGICLAGWSIDFINTYFFKNKDSDFISDIFETIIIPYRYSYEIEQLIVQSTLDVAYDIFDDLAFNISSFTGDSDHSYYDELVVGRVTRVNEDYELPTYYATGYATSASYYKGQMDYNIEQPELNIREIKSVESLFKVTYDVVKEDLENYIDGYEINLRQLFYPLGNNYVLTRLTIWDAEDNTRYFTIDYERTLITGNLISQEEKDFILSLRNPRVTCSYGISYEFQNSFVTNMEKSSPYTSLSSSVVREALTHGLELESDATLEEIFEAIKSKYYSTTPIKDAGLSNRIRKMDEKEFIETIASLDSLVCNLAATLAVDADSDLTYVVGFYDDGNGILQGKESHAWAVNPNGTIIDITPYAVLEDEDISSIIRGILIWGLKKGISIYIIVALINMLFKKIFGYNIIFTIQVFKLEKLLNTPDIEEAYAAIKDILYGGINLPNKTTPWEFIDIVNKELSCLNREDLKDLVTELESRLSQNKVLYGNALKIIENRTFIRKNAQELKRVLKKEK